MRREEHNEHYDIALALSIGALIGIATNYLFPKSLLNFVIILVLIVYFKVKLSLQKKHYEQN